MPVIEQQRHCGHCGRYVLARKQGCNHLVHAVITLFLCGFWLPIWFLAWLASLNTPYRCTSCGNAI